MNLTESLNVITNEINTGEENIPIMRSEELRFLIPSNIFHF